MAFLLISFLLPLPLPEGSALAGILQQLDTYHNPSLCQGLSLLRVLPPNVRDRRF